MDKQNENVRLPKWVIVNIVILFLFAAILAGYTFQKIHNEWVGFACWFLIVILLLFPGGIGIIFYLKIKKHNDLDQLKNEKINKENEQEKHLTDLHHEYRLKALQYEIRLKEIEIEKLKIEKGKG